AASPESAIRFGSASRRTRPLVSSAVSSRSIDWPLFSLRTLVSRLPYGVAPPISVPKVPSSGRLPVGGAPTEVPPVPRRPGVVLIPPIGDRPAAVTPPSPVLPTLVPLALAP